MSSSDVTISVLIVCTFIFLYMFNFFVVGFKQIKDNWPIYRCNPVVMPFAALFGFNAGENFAFCIQNMQSAFMGELLKPVNYNLGALNSVGGGLSGNVTGIQAMFDKIRNSVSGALKAVFGIFLNMMIEMQRIMMNMKDLMGKLMGVMSVSLYTMSGGMMAMNSMWDGPPGEMVRLLCFEPDTLVDVLNDEGFQQMKMKDLPLNAILRNGTRVCAVMHISNLDNNGAQVEKVYKLPYYQTGQPGQNIFVSGSHLVYSYDKKQFVPVHALTEAQETDKVCPTFTCLITNDHTIPIGDWLFHDWEDNQGSPAKNRV